MENGFYKNEYFKQLDQRLDVLEKKIDKIHDKVNFIYAWSAGVGTAAAFIINYFIK